MGKAARWFRCLRGLKKEESQSQSAAKPPKRRWTFVKSHRERDGTAANNITDDPTGCTGGDGGGGVDPSKHAIAVAAATAAVAEAAVAAAQAAQAVVKLTSSGRSNASAVYVSGASCGVREEWAAVTIQSHFRGYLARRALRALKGLVKLQALVRGHIVRKKTKDMVRRMQALLRAQARACAGRAQVSESPHSSNKSSQFQGPATPEKFEHDISSKITKHDQSPMLLKRSGSKSIARVIIDQDKARNGWNGLDHRMDEGSRDQKRLSTKTGQTDNEKSDKILEVDSGKLHLASKRKNLFLFNPHGLASDQYSHSFSTSKDSTTRQTVLSPSSCEVHSLNPLKFTQDNEESPFCTANNSPQFYSASSRSGSSRRGPFTPCKSDGSRSNLSGYSDHPNYMACTESSRAKVRSLSAPKQRPQFERSVSTKRYSVHGFGESRSRSQRVSALNANFANKAYPGSGRLDRLAMPVRGDAIGA